MRTARAMTPWLLLLGLLAGGCDVQPSVVHVHHVRIVRVPHDAKVKCFRFSGAFSQHPYVDHLPLQNIVVMECWSEGMPACEVCYQETP